MGCVKRPCLLATNAKYCRAAKRKAAALRSGVQGARREPSCAAANAVAAAGACCCTQPSSAARVPFALPDRCDARACQHRHAPLIGTGQTSVPFLLVARHEQRESGATNEAGACTRREKAGWSRSPAHRPHRPPHASGTSCKGSTRRSSTDPGGSDVGPVDTDGVDQHARKQLLLLLHAAGAGVALQLLRAWGAAALPLPTTHSAPRLNAHLGE